MLTETEIEECNTLLESLEGIWTVSRSLLQDDVKSILQKMALESIAHNIGVIVQLRVRGALNVPEDVMIGLTHYEAAGLTVPDRMANEMVEVTTAIANGELDDLI